MSVAGGRKLRNHTARKAGLEFSRSSTPMRRTVVCEERISNGEAVARGSPWSSADCWLRRVAEERTLNTPIAKQTATIDTTRAGGGDLLILSSAGPIAEAAKSARILPPDRVAGNQGEDGLSQSRSHAPLGHERSEVRAIDGRGLVDDGQDKEAELSSEEEGD